MSRQLLEEAKKVLQGEAAVKLDPVGQEDKDVDNDGDADKTDSYLKKRRGAISAAIAKSKNESVKPDLSEEDAQRVSNILKGVAEETDQIDEGNKKNKELKNKYVASIIQKKLHSSVLPSLKYGRQQLKKEELEQVEEGNNNQKTFKVVHYSPTKDRTVTKKIKASSKSEVWDMLKSKGIDVVSVKEQHMPEETDQIDEMDKSQSSSSRGAEGPPVGREAKPISYDKVKKDAYGALKNQLNKKYQKVKEETEQVDEMQVANKYALKGPQPAEVPAYMRKGNARKQFPLKLDDLKRKDTMSDIENLRKMEEVDLDESDDLGPITKKQKTVMVTHKTSGREKVIVDTPENRKRNAEMGFHAKSDETEKNEAISHQTATTMKHAKNPTPQQVIFGRKIKPGVGGYSDRAAMLRDLEKTGRVKEESVDLEEVSEIIESRNSFTIDLPETLTYEHYLKAAMQAEGIESLKELDDETLMPFLTFVEQMFVEGQEEFVISELTYSELQDKIYAHQKGGNKVTGIERKTMNGQPYAAYVVTDKSGMRRKYIYQGNVRRVQSLGQDRKPNETNPLED